MNKITMHFPSVFFPDEEPNRFLLKYKTSLQKRWTLTQMKTLFEEVDLAYYLTALDRNEEALRVVTFITENLSFDGNYNRWTPAGYALSLQARLHRLAGDHDAFEAALARIRMHPFLITRPEDISRILSTTPAKIEEFYQDQSKKWACHRLARLLYSLCYYRETGGQKDFLHANWYVPDTLEVYILDGFQKLRIFFQEN